MGLSHICAIQLNGELFCFGRFAEGQSKAPRVESPWVHVSASEGTTCGVTQSGEGYCWGALDLRPPVLQPWAVISVGFAHACGLLINGTALCWGEDQSGGAASPLAVPDVGQQPWVSITTGSTATCGILANGSAVCWGVLDYGIAIGFSMGLPPFVQLSIGFRHACGLLISGHITCTGIMTDGVLEVPDVGEPWRAVTAAGESTCGITVSHRVVCWGRDLLWAPSFVGQRIAQIALSRPVAGWGGCIVALDGFVNCWGRPTLGNQRAFTVPQERGRLLAIDSSDTEYCAVDEAQLAWCWPGQLNDMGPMTSRNLVKTWRMVRSGKRQTCGLDTKGELVCWKRPNMAGIIYSHNSLFPDPIEYFDYDYYYLCGIDSNRKLKCPYVTFPTASFSLPGVEAYDWSRVSMTDTAVCAITTEGMLACWTSKPENPIRDVPFFGEGVQCEAVAVSPTHACAVLSNHSLACWGSNDLGQLEVPGADAGIMWKSVAVTSGATCAVTMDGHALCWGQEEVGQPPSVGDLPPGCRWSSLALQATSGCGLLDCGRIECWGVVPDSAEPPAPFAPLSDSIEVPLLPNAAIGDHNMAAGDQCICFTVSVDPSPSSEVRCLGSNCLKTPVSVHVDGEVEDLAVGKYSVAMTYRNANNELMVRLWSSAVDAIEGPLPPVMAGSLVVDFSDRVCLLTANKQPLCWAPLNGALVPRGSFGVSLQQLFLKGNILCGRITNSAALWCDPLRYSGQAPSIPLPNPSSQIHASHINSDFSGCAVYGGNKELTCWSLNMTSFSPFDSDGFVKAAFTHHGIIALDSSGSLWCTGSACGRAGVDHRYRSYQVGWTAMFASETSACALLSHDKLSCSGVGIFHFQVAPTFSRPHVHVVPLQEVPGEAACVENTAAHCASPVKVSVNVNTTCTITDQGTLFCAGTSGVEAGLLNAVYPGESWVDVAAGTGFACGITSSGDLRCSGGINVGAGQTPADLEQGVWQAVAVGSLVTCGVSTNHSITCFGWDFANENDVPENVTAVALSVGEFIVCAVTLESRIVCWGTCPDDQCTPFEDSEWSAVAAWYSYSCGIATNGTLHCWGDVPQPAPPSEGPWLDIAVTANAACGVLLNGTAVCWGQGSLTPPAVEEGWASIAVSTTHACGVTNSGVAHCWGTLTDMQTLPRCMNTTSIYCNSLEAAVAAVPSASSLSMHEGSMMGHVRWGPLVLPSLRGVSTLPHGPPPQVFCSADYAPCLSAVGGHRLTLLNMDIRPVQSQAQQSFPLLWVVDKEAFNAVAMCITGVKHAPEVPMAWIANVADVAFTSIAVLNTGGGLLVHNTTSVHIENATFQTALGTLPFMVPIPFTPPLPWAAAIDFALVEVVGTQAVVLRNATFRNSNGRLHVRNGSSFLAHHVVVADASIAFPPEGAVVIAETPNVTLQQCDFLSNKAPSALDGVVSVTIAQAPLVELRISHCRFYDNAAMSHGALSISDSSGVAASSYSFHLTNVSFASNTQSTDGAALYWSNAKKFIDGSQVVQAPLAVVYVDGVAFTSNTGIHRGGAWFTAGIDITGRNAVFQGNSASTGGAVYLEGGSYSVYNSSFVSNSASNRGGAISASQCTPTGIVLEQPLFEMNAVTLPLEGMSGGALAVSSCAVTVSSGRFWQNRAGVGGAIYLDALGSLDVASTAFLENSAVARGGSVAGYSHASIRLQRCTFVSSSSVDGGAIYASEGVTALNASMLRDNVGSSGGGAVMVVDGRLIMTNTECSGNVGEREVSPGYFNRGSGGCLAAANSHLELNNVTMTGNRAVFGGAMAITCPVYTYQAAPRAVIIAGNTARKGGGGGYFKGCSAYEIPQFTGPAVAWARNAAGAYGMDTATSPSSVAVVSHEASLVNGVTYSSPVAVVELKDFNGSAVVTDDATVCAVSFSSSETDSTADRNAFNSKAPLSYVASGGRVDIAPLELRTDLVGQRAYAHIACDGGLTAVFGFMVLRGPSLTWYSDGTAPSALPSSGTTPFILSPPPTLAITSNFQTADLSGTCTLDAMAQVQLQGTLSRDVSSAVAGNHAQQWLLRFTGISVIVSSWDAPVVVTARCLFGRGDLVTPPQSLRLQLQVPVLAWEVPLPALVLPSSPSFTVPLSPAPTLTLHRSGNNLAPVPIQTSCKIESLVASAALVGSVEAPMTNGRAQFSGIAVMGVQEEESSRSIAISHTLRLQVTCAWYNSLVLRDANITAATPAVTAEATPRHALHAFDSTPLQAALAVVYPQLLWVVNPGLQPQHVTCELSATSVDHDGVTATLIGAAPIMFNASTATVSLPTSLAIAVPRGAYGRYTLDLACSLRRWYPMPPAQWQVQVFPQQLVWQQPPPAMILPSTRQQGDTFTAALRLTNATDSPGSPSSSEAQALPVDGTCTMEPLLVEGEGSVSLTGAATTALTNGVAAFADIGVSAYFGDEVELLVSCRRSVGGEPLWLSHTLTLPILHIDLVQLPPPQLPPQSQFRVGAAVVGANGTLAAFVADIAQCSLATANASFQLVNSYAVSERGYLSWPAVTILGPLMSQLSLSMACAINGYGVPTPPDFTVFVGGCRPGEEPDRSGAACVACGEGKYSDGVTHRCNGCPSDGATCDGGALVLRNGYFPASTALLHGPWPQDEVPLLYMCPNPAVCHVSPDNRTYYCSPGYEGPLCGVCASGYAQSSPGSCSMCWPSWANSLVLMLGAMAILGLLVYVTLFQRHKEATSAAIFLRMLLTYLQLLNSLTTFRANATETFRALFAFTATVGSGIASIPVLQCTFHWGFFTKFIVTVTLPLLVTVGSISIAFLAMTLRHLRPMSRQQPAAAALPSTTVGSSSSSNVNRRSESHTTHSDRHDGGSANHHGANVNSGSSNNPGPKPLLQRVSMRNLRMKNLPPRQGSLWQQCKYYLKSKTFIAPMLFIIFFCCKWYLLPCCPCRHSLTLLFMFLHTPSFLLSSRLVMHVSSMPQTTPLCLLSCLCSNAAQRSLMASNIWKTTCALLVTQHPMLLESSLRHWWRWCTMWGYRCSLSFSCDATAQSFGAPPWWLSMASFIRDTAWTAAVTGGRRCSCCGNSCCCVWLPL